MEDLDESIVVLGQDALALRPPGHPDRSSFFNNLAARLSYRHNRFGVVEDLNEAIVLDRDALVLRPPGDWELSSRLGTLTARKVDGRDKRSRHHVAETLGRNCLPHREHPPGDTSMSITHLVVPHRRVLSSSPHAAGPYWKGQHNLANLYTSSYTSTLTASLLDGTIPRILHQKGNTSLVQAQAKGEKELVSVGAELANISQRVDGLATFTHVGDRKSCIPRVTEELMKNEWVHLACRGLPNRRQPFESAFALHDGHFTIERIIRCELQNAEFVYLSACHTTVGDEESPES